MHFGEVVSLYFSCGYAVLFFLRNWRAEDGGVDNPRAGASTEGE